MPTELFPLLSGVLAGLLVQPLRPSLRLHIGAILAIILGSLATIVSGEFRIGWEFLLIDIPLVALTAAATASTGSRARLLLRRD